MRALVGAVIYADSVQIAHNEFPIPELPPPPPPPDVTGDRLMSPLPSSPLEEQSSSQEANKENAPVQPPAPQVLAPGELPKQIVDMLGLIEAHLQSFAAYPPHTIQRLAELILSPRPHYKALASYLHAVDRVVQVTSGTDTYPLPLAIPDMSSMNVNGEDTNDPASAVAWSNPTTAAVGSDEALGGALLTPIPWLMRRPSPDSGDDGPGAQIHSESTETIDGPNGMGSIETVSVSVNGVPSMGHARGITQGELLREEQRAGVVPKYQKTQVLGSATEQEPRPEGSEEHMLEEHAEEEDEIPHARGPEEIGLSDTGLQGTTTSYMGEGGVEMQGIDVEAAVGRKHADEDAPAPGSEDKIDVKTDAETEEAAEGQSPGAESTGTKREADQELEAEAAKKIKEGEEDAEAADATEAVETKTEEAPEDDAVKAGTAEDEQGDKMDTDK